MLLSDFSVGPWCPNSHDNDFVRVKAFDRTRPTVLRMDILIHRYWISDTLKPVNDTPEGRHLEVVKQAHERVATLANVLYNDPKKWTKEPPLRINEDYGKLKIG